MKTYKHEFRKTRWNRWHIFMAITWNILFFTTLVKTVLSFATITADGSAVALLQCTLNLVCFIALTALIKPLREKYYFQQIMDDCNCNNQSAYNLSGIAEKEMIACELMEEIESPQIEPFQRQSLRMKLKQIAQENALSGPVLEQIRARHGYLL